MTEQDNESKRGTKGGKLSRYTGNNIFEKYLYFINLILFILAY